jgi:hypothetical protein
MPPIVCSKRVATEPGTSDVARRYVTTDPQLQPGGRLWVLGGQLNDASQESSVLLSVLGDSGVASVGLVASLEAFTAI